MAPITRPRRGARRGGAPVVTAEGRGDRARQGRRICVLLIILSGRRQGLVRVAVGVAAVSFTVNPKVVEPPTAMEPLQEKRTRGGSLRAIDAASRDRGTHTTRASRTTVLTARHQMAGGSRLEDTVWEILPKCVKPSEKVSGGALAVTGGGP
ncbi:hypothetical protein GCM10011574_71560 [Microbispora bryophytorum]|uniref:Uncharacterized protein n=1 Tax=Microbispora bryophytorum TaxID=1460882 RepID=A0A8H9H7K6_9ACTN|nr:hypothetical protein GCM10011574_71560 [Microbispora bryophytorum]